MARSIWNGNISFGLINIPVALHSAVRDHRPHLRLLHASDKSPIRNNHVCQKEGRPVSWNDLVKGFEYEKGKFVVLTKEDFQTAAVEKTRSIDILDFVSADEIDDRYFVTPYYLLPAKGAERAYALLREALRETGRVGIAKLILREAQHLIALEVVEEALVLTMMRFSDELIDASEYTFPPVSLVGAREKKMACSLINSLSANFDPAKYTDEYRENLMRLIQSKLKGKEVKLKEPQEGEHGGEVGDLMERLLRSLEAAPPRKAAAAKKALPAPKAAKTAKTARTSKGAKSTTTARSARARPAAKTARAQPAARST